MVEDVELKFCSSIIVIMLFLSPVLLRDYSGISVSTVEGVDRAMISESTGEDWLSGWTYRKSHVINGATGAGSDYQVQIIVNYSLGVDTGEVVHCDNLCKSDFSDIRFTDGDGITELDYWLEEFHDSDNATFWVEVADNLDTDQTIFVYFGNAMAISNSNGEDTFIFFDDFDDGAIDAGKWDAYGPWAESGGTASFSITSTGSNIDFPALRTYSGWDMRNKSFASRWQFDENTVNRQWGMSCTNDDGTMLSYFIGGSHVTPVSDIYFDLDHAVEYDHDVDAIDSWPIDTYFRTEFSSTPNGTTKNDWLLNHESISVYNGNSFTSALQRIYLGFYAYAFNFPLNAGTLMMDFNWVYLKHQVGAEPAHGDWGFLESEPEDGLGWLSGWEFRKAHRLNGSAGAGHNYQVKIAVYQGSGVDSGSDVYSDGSCQTDFDDIRFTDNDGITELDYWMEESHDSDNATFWVEVRDTLDYDQSLYIYYGNPDVMSTSDGFSTFIFFDDFDGESIGADLHPDRWWYESAQLSTDYVRITLDPVDSSNQVAAATESGDTVANVVWANSWEPTKSLAIGHKFRYDLDYKGYYVTRTATMAAVFEEQLENTGTNDHEWYDASLGYFDFSPSLITVTDEWYSWEYRFTESSMTVYDKGNEVLAVGGYVYADVGETGTTCLRYGLRFGANTWWSDDLYVRKFISSEPTHGLWGVLEFALSVGSPADITYEAGTTGHSIEWSASSYHPHFFHKYLDGTTTSVSTWDGTSIDQSVDGLDPGSYNFTLRINNTFGYSLIDSVTVIVEDTTHPILSHPGDVEYTEGDLGNDITWTLDDLYPEEYQIHIDDELLRAGAWNSTGEAFTLSVDGFSVGIYNVSISAIDESGNSAVDYVTVTVQPRFPIMIALMVGGVAVIVIIGAAACRMKK